MNQKLSRGGLPRIRRLANTSLLFIPTERGMRNERNEGVFSFRTVFLHSRQAPSTALRMIIWRSGVSPPLYKFLLSRKMWIRRSLDRRAPK